MKTEQVNPNLRHFIESLRDIGYSTEVAVADLIDNSITAGCSVVKIYSVVYPAPIFCMLDNGIGMTEQELVEAMRLASKNPNDERNKDDLGRFGLGLKTSSFSQCRKLTVVSKKADVISCRQWDLEYISQKDEWLLIEPDDFSQFPLVKELTESESGTLVIWQEIDRVQLAGFSGMIDQLRKHLSLVFHKFLEGSVPGKKLNIIINDNPVAAFNPFNLNHPATQQISVEKINIYGQSVIIQPVILPHHSKISQQDYDLYATEEGYIKSQGFYLYRANRILIYGTWWGLHKAMDAHKLVRVRIEIPNSMDRHWGIDIKKSTARPVEEIKGDLRRIILQVTEKGSRPFTGRGKRIEDKTVTQFWELVSQNGELTFRINYDHPVYTKVVSELTIVQKDVLNLYLKGLQAYLPLDAIQARLQRDPHSIKQQAILSESDIFTLAEKLKEIGLNNDQIKELLKTEMFKGRSNIFKDE